MLYLYKTRIEKFISNTNLSLFLFSILIFTFSCYSPKSKDKERWNEFYTRFLFIEGAAFSIHGSKPITEIILDHRAKDEKELERNKNISKLSRKEKKEIESHCIKWNPRYDFEESWRIWETNLKKDLIKDYLIVHFPLNASDLDFVFFVNVIETAKTLQKHYSLFSKYIGFEFDPLEIVFDISDKESIFWNKIFNGEKNQKKVCLIGILFGYGLENSYIYSLIFHKNKEEIVGNFVSNLFNRIINLEHLDSFEKIKSVSSSNFPIPGFKSFSNPDPKIDQYQKEKQFIKYLYKDKDMENTTMNALYGGIFFNISNLNTVCLEKYVENF